MLTKVSMASSLEVIMVSMSTCIDDEPVFVSFQEAYALLQSARLQDTRAQQKVTAKIRGEFASVFVEICSTCYMPASLSCSLSLCFLPVLLVTHVCICKLSRILHNKREVHQVGQVDYDDR